MLKIFNTISHSKEKFIPIKNNRVNIYVCGVTVYNCCHIGHGRTFVIFDIVSRYFRHIGYKTNYVRNITDIDDKIISLSIKNNESITVFTNRMIKSMHRDFSLLNILPPDEEPKVTENIDAIIKVIDNLLKKNYAYVQNNGDVMFSVDKDVHYGKLSNQFLKKLKLGKRVKIDKNKRNPLDFVLWKKVPLSEKFYWNSPWGKGRPGWHIECTAMSSVKIGNLLDIHGGGIDLLFPHHENERAQFSCFKKESRINYWMHSGMVVLNNKKMSKSLENFILLKDLLSKYDGESIRYFLISTHYRRPLNYCEENIKKSSISLRRLYVSLRNTLIDKNFSFFPNKYQVAFEKAMQDDFNTPKALLTLHSLSKKINILKKENKLEKVEKFSNLLRKLGKVLGLFYSDPELFLQKNIKIKEEKEINSLIKKRNIARKLKMWSVSDNIRKKLFELGIILEDDKLSTTWRKK
ncbi:cysteine--tRNA ligase [Buchnera aphidicola]|uniref:cysteine--tRNA ligase n=1 Tax=Buchnera aphidicola TaxID=9 RepID=UPI0031B6EA90